MDNIQTQLYRELDDGIELKATFEGSDLLLTFVVGDADFDRIPLLYDPARFESSQMHVGQLDTATDLTSEIADILGLTQSGDTVLFFCSTHQVLCEALAVVGYPHHPLS